MEDYNLRYYNFAVKCLKDMKYYSGDVVHDCANHIKRFFPAAVEEDVVNAVNWAIADTWNGGCEVELV